ncbi:hypothetical protein SAMN05421874_13730 [Nonomuraea maritima]|uniref:Uncharacterized protein n=1 Tax=Nonomuraea maritima TaxID=683260 RepID=A0A1G9Q5T3_9ACTN|nr:hypothetical protein [Nonomuraea maritima]SDM06101.1 hypothetical protein SAMN05421874_13730 [Nonomuraea maritima]
MTPQQPGPPEPDPDRTVRHRIPRPARPPSAETPDTQRLPYTPDMLPDVSHYATKPPKSAWWWVVVTGSLLLLVAAVAVAVILWADNATAHTLDSP